MRKFFDYIKIIYKALEEMSICDICSYATCKRCGGKGYLDKKVTWE